MDKATFCKLCFDGSGFNPTSSTIIFWEFASLMTRVHLENKGGSSKSEKLKKMKRGKCKVLAVLGFSCLMTQVQALECIRDRLNLTTERMTKIVIL